MSINIEFVRAYRPIDQLGIGIYIKMLLPREDELTVENMKLYIHDQLPQIRESILLALDGFKKEKL